MIFKLIILFVCILSISCKDLNSLLKTHHSKSPKIFPLPEPVIRDGDTQIKFKEFVNQKKHLQLKSHIHFTKLDTTSKTSLTDITLTIQTHCIVNTDKQITQTFTKPIKPSISILELIPQDVFLFTKSTPPVCSFSFHAKNKAGDSHYFKLPPIPIDNFPDKHRLKIISPSGTEISKEFPYVLFNEFHNYWISFPTQEPSRHLHFICENNTSSSFITSQQFIPFWHFPPIPINKDLKKLITNQPYQKCRILSYHNKTREAVSLTFHLVHDIQPPLVYVTNHFNKHDNPFQQAILHKALPQENQDLPVYDYNILNTHSYPVNILILKPVNESGDLLEELKIPIYSVYYDRNESMYETNYLYLDFSDILKHIKENNTEAVIISTSDGLLITIPPKSKITFPARINDRFQFCTSSRWLGSFITVPHLEIHQLISGNHNLISLSENMTGKLIPPHSKNITFPEEENWFYNENLAPLYHTFVFRNGSCTNTRGIRIHDNKPPLSIYSKTGRYGDTHMKIEFVPLHIPIHMDEYKKTHHFISNVLFPKSD